MRQISVHEVKRHFSRLLSEVEGGEEIIITRRGHPVAKLVQFHPPDQQRRLGRDAGLLEVPEDFDAPLPEEVLGPFES